MVQGQVAEIPLPQRGDDPDVGGVPGGGGPVRRVLVHERDARPSGPAPPRGTTRPGAGRRRPGGRSSGRPRRPRCRARGRSPPSTTRTGSPPVPRMSRSGRRRSVQYQPVGRCRSSPRRTRSGSTASRGRAAEERQVGIGEGELGGRAAQLRAEDVRVLRVEHGRLDRPAEDRLRVVHEVGVERIVPGDEHGQRARGPRVRPGRPAATARPACPGSPPAPRRPARRCPRRAPARWWPPPRAACRSPAPPPAPAAPPAGSRPGTRRPGPPAPARCPPGGGGRTAATTSAPRRERTKASARASSTTRSASSRAASAPADRRTGAPCSPRAPVSGGSQSAKAVAPRGEASSVTSSTGTPVSRLADSAGFADRRRGQHEGRPGAVRGADPPQPAQHVRDVRAEDAAIGVALVDHHVPQPAQERRPTGRATAGCRGAACPGWSGRAGSAPGPSPARAARVSPSKDAARTLEQDQRAERPQLVRGERLGRRRGRARSPSRR